MLRRSALVCLLLIVSSLPTLGAGLEVRPVTGLCIQSGESVPVAFMVYNGGDARVAGDAALTSRSASLTPASVPVDLGPGDWKLVVTRAAINPSASTATVVCSVKSVSASVQVIHGLDLTDLSWRRTFTAHSSAPDPRLASPETDDSPWQEIRPISMWDFIGYGWCRVRFIVPESWKGTRLHLVMGAVDDCDVTYLNGEEIGRTAGWDARRDYVLPDRLIRWGGENLLTVMVDNTGSGGGMSKAPFAIVPEGASATSAWAPTLVPIIRPKPGRIGSPLPLRRIHVQDGVLRYPDGDEVSMWGVNYYPQSWYQFENMMKLKLNMKAVIRRDLDHMKLMGIDVIRIHVFDREISNGKGEIIPNIHLDLLDYLVSECDKRGIYMYFTPIAWWGGPNEIKGAFSQVTTKPGMIFVPEAKDAAANYLMNFLNHRNKYTGRSYKDEPCLCFLEIQNEPSYFGYSDMAGSGYTPQGEPQELLDRDRKTLRTMWTKWLADHGLADSSAFFPAFRYELMRAYLRRMVAAIRSTGAVQPICENYLSVTENDLIQAIADSEVDALSLSTYPGGLSKISDGQNLLQMMGPMVRDGRATLPYWGVLFDGRLNKKARVAYEFDADGANTGQYLYPAISATFRSGDVQIACQFQYDTYADARWNPDWGTHYLNWLYTPSKAVSYMIGGEAFRRLPRGVDMKQGTNQMIVGPMATSFEQNISMLLAPDTVMHSRSLSEWIPLELPQSPKRIVATGSSPYVEYGGTGIYTLDRIDSNTMRLRINPDARHIGNCIAGSFATSVAVLEEHPQWFQLKLKGWQKARFTRDGKAVPAVSGGWLVAPGEYVIRR